MLAPVRTYIRGDSACSNPAVSGTQACRGFVETAACIETANHTRCLKDPRKDRRKLTPTMKLMIAKRRPPTREHMRRVLNAGVNSYLQYAWVLVCLRSALQFEESHTLSYSWLIRTRPDIVFALPFPPEARLVQTFGDHRLITTPKGGGTFDGVWLMPRRIADGYMSRLDACFAQTDHGIHRFYPPEGFSFACVQKMGIPFSCSPIAAILMRGCSAGSPKCSGQCGWLRRSGCSQCPANPQGWTVRDPAPGSNLTLRLDQVTAACCSLAVASCVLPLLSGPTSLCLDQVCKQYSRWVHGSGAHATSAGWTPSFDAAARKAKRRATEKRWTEINPGNQSDFEPRDPMRNEQCNDGGFADNMFEDDD